MKPYIGVTGFTDIVEVCHAFSAMFNDRYDGTYRLMVGVLASRTSLYGNYSKGRYAHMQTLPHLFLPYDNALNLIHFSTNNKNELVNDLTRLKEISGPNLNGFQLNIKWPDPKEIEKYRDGAGGTDTIVLQVGAGALAEVNNDPKKLVQVLKDNYSYLVDFVLLDESGGTGKNMDLVKMDNYLEEIYASTDENDFMVGIAGGWSWQTIKDRWWILEKYQQLSIDAENKLINEPTDKLVPHLTKKYVEEAKRLLMNRRINNGISRAAVL